MAMRNPHHRRRVVIGFALIVVAYQLPEGVGQRLMGSFRAQAVLLLAFFPIAWGVGRWLARTAAEAYALEASRRVIRLGAACFAFAVVTKAAAVAAGIGLGAYAWAGVPAAGTAAALVAGLGLTFAPSIAEDIVTRGFWYRASGIRWSPSLFVAASAGLYVLNHIYRLGLGPAEWMMLFAFGLTYALAVVRGRSLWLAVGFHWGWNYANLAIDALRPYATLSAPGSRALSIGAHAVMAAFVIWLTRQPPGAGPQERPPSGAGAIAPDDRRGRPAREP